MRKCLLIFILCLLCPAIYSQQAPSDAEIKSAIAKLGKDVDQDNFSGFDLLYQDPRRAAEFLTKSLKSVAEGQYTSKQQPQAVWRIRALRSLTGLDFRATTKSHLNEDQVHFLDPNQKGEIRFFGVWRTQDIVWVAPSDAQNAIIKKWQQWFEKYGQTFAYVNNHNVDDWYF